ncbi:hypothetical protein [Facilibium subflavum]|uniref:hypothetical protein n=1 Tax=Facilibium subflavum TaxID=2219058 RepID=UPI000E6495EB|nr:hypothetical protein [Facilibium subflavum]
MNQKKRPFTHHYASAFDGYLNVNIAYPISGILGYRDITSNHSFASAIISLSIYCFAGIIIYLCSYITLSSFYIYGIIILIVSVIVMVITYKEITTLNSMDFRH